MRTISQWLHHLFWRARSLPNDGPSDLLTVGLSFVGRPEWDTDPQPDLWLDTSAVDDAECMLVHLARLGTADLVLVFGCAELPASARRRLDRLARQLRQLGVVVVLER